MRGEYVLNNIVSDDKGDTIIYFNVSDREKVKSDEDRTQDGGKKGNGNLMWTYGSLIEILFTTI